MPHTGTDFTFNSQTAFRFMEAVLKAAKGEKGIVQPSYVYLPGIHGGEIVKNSVDGIDYFSANLELGVHT